MGPKLVDYLLYEPEDSGIAWIKFNRPERQNALMGNSQENGTVAKVGEYMRAADDDPKIRVIVLTGEGQGFCSGADMRRDNDQSVLGDNFTGNRDHTEGPDLTRQHFFPRVHSTAPGHLIDPQTDHRYDQWSSRGLGHGHGPPL